MSELVLTEIQGFFQNVAEFVSLIIITVLGGGLVLYFIPFAVKKAKIMFNILCGGDEYGRPRKDGWY